MSHDMLSLEVHYSTFVFVKQVKENRNTQYYRIAIQIESAAMYRERIESGEEHISPINNPGNLVSLL